MTDENDLVAASLVFSPRGAQVAAHRLVNSLKNDFARCALHPEYAFVAQHPGPIYLDQVADKVFQLGWIKRLFAPENKGRDAVSVMAMMVVMLHVVMFMTMVMVAMIVTVVVRIFCLQKVGIDLQLVVEVEATDIEDFVNRCAPKVGTTQRRTRVDSP